MMWEELKDYIYDQIQLEAENVDIKGFNSFDNFGIGKLEALDGVLRKIKEIEQNNA